MFDIRFFQNTFDLKKEIVGGKHGPEGASAIFSQFEKQRNKSPFLFNIETTNNCNMRCVMCPRTTEMTRRVQNMEAGIFEKVARQIRPHTEADFKRWVDFVKSEYGLDENDKNENSFYFFVSSRAVTMHGYGEPLLDPKIAERVKAFSGKNIPSYFSCNPSNIKVDKIEDLFMVGLSYLKFSLDSLDSEEMRRIRGGHIDYSRDLGKMLRVLGLKEEGGHRTEIVICMIKMPQTKNEEVGEFLKTWEGKDAFVYVKSLDNQWYVTDLEAKKAKSHYESQYCEFPWTSLTVMADGTVVPCTQDFDCEMSMGNARDSSLEDIWNSKQYEDFREAHITGRSLGNYKCKKRCDLRTVSDYLI